ncbi:helix-turn-helix domain-containing protein [Xenorhabdus cabanillasii]|nr:winged helix-turn-helix domain-containing protein [Xenorhabdus cabanillasii]PHM76453.1 transposase [Xenorhabdus cabanillasii JM26]
MVSSIWSRNAIQALIWQMWRIKMVKRTLTDYLKRWGFTPQKPLKRAYEQNPKAVEKWHKETCPTVKKKSARMSEKDPKSYDEATEKI